MTEIRKQGDLMLTGAQELCTSLIHCLLIREPVALDLEAVTEVDLASLQVLLAAERSFAASGLPLEIRESECIRSSRAEAGYPARGGADCQKPS